MKNSTIALSVLSFCFILSQAVSAGQPVYRAVARQVVLPPVSLIPEDGTMTGWVTVKKGGSVPPAWKNENGELHLVGKGGDIRTERNYVDFILDFSWTIEKAGNSGIKYRFKEFGDDGWLGLEYQIMDDYHRKTLKHPVASTASLYEIVPPRPDKNLRPHDQVNHGRIVVNGSRIRHWLNGLKVVDVVVGSPEWNRGMAAGKFAGIEGYGLNPVGLIMLQDHDHEIRFHHLTLREIKTETVSVPKRTLRRNR